MPQAAPAQPSTIGATEAACGIRNRAYGFSAPPLYEVE